MTFLPKRSPSSYPSRIMANVIFRHVIIIAIITNCSEAYITYRLNDVHAYQYPCMASELGVPFLDNYYTANLFIAPVLNMNMCKSTNLTDSENVPNNPDDFRRNLNLANNPMEDIPVMSQPTPDRHSPIEEINSMARRLKGSKSSSERELNEYNPIPMALLLQAGGECTLAEKARNVMEVNDNYAVPGGPRIEFLVMIRDDSKYPAHGVPNGDSNYIGQDFRITYISQDPAESLISLMKQIYVIWMPPGSAEFYLNPRSFIPRSDRDLDAWSFYVILDDMMFSFPYAFILYVFIALIIGVPLLRYIVLVIMNRGFRFRRDDDGRVDGITWNRMQRRFRGTAPRDWHMRQGTDEGSIFLNAWREIESRLTLGKLTEEQIKALPIIEYNVSDIEEINRRYNDEKMDAQVNDNDNAKVNGNNTEDDAEISSDIEAKDNEGALTDNAKNSTSRFLQNAFSSFPMCSICIDEFDEGEKLIMLPACAHFFHPQCISTWLKDTRSTCPLCQVRVSPPDVSPNCNNNSEDVNASRSVATSTMGIDTSLQSID